MQHNSKKWRALFVGDLYIRNGHTEIVSNEVKQLIEAHDIASFNFEGPIELSSGEPIVKAGVHLCQHPKAAEAVKEAGFNVASLANNHICDYGADALSGTLKAFSDIDVVGAGATFEQANALRKRCINGIEVGLLAYCEAEFGALMEEQGQYGYAWVNHPRVNEAIRGAKAEVDVLLVQVHAGVEGVDLPLPEWRQRYRELIGNGADAVIAHHPHVPQGWELYAGKPIYYSLGNFYFDLPRADTNWDRGYMVSLTYDGDLLQDHQVIPVEKRDGVVALSQDSAYGRHLKTIVHQLKEEVYQGLMDQQVLELWESRYQRYYVAAAHGHKRGKSLADYIRGIVCRLFNRIQFDNALLLHNLRIESHRWAVERALTILLHKHGKGL